MTSLAKGACLLVLSFVAGSCTANKEVRPPSVSTDSRPALTALTPKNVIGKSFPRLLEQAGKGGGTFYLDMSIPPDGCIRAIVDSRTGKVLDADGWYPSNDRKEAMSVPPEIRSFFHGAPDDDLKAFTRLRIGMSEKEVRQVVGKPAGAGGVGNITWWDYFLAGRGEQAGGMALDMSYGSLRSVVGWYRDRDGTVYSVDIHLDSSCTVNRDVRTPSVSKDSQSLATTESILREVKPHNADERVLLAAALPVLQQVDQKTRLCEKVRNSECWSLMVHVSVGVGFNKQSGNYYTSPREQIRSSEADRRSPHDIVLGPEQVSVCAVGLSGKRLWMVGDVMAPLAGKSGCTYAIAFDDETPKLAEELQGICQRALLQTGWQNGKGSEDGAMYTLVITGQRGSKVCFVSGVNVEGDDSTPGRKIIRDTFGVQGRLFDSYLRKIGALEDADGNDLE